MLALASDEAITYGDVAIGLIIVVLVLLLIYLIRRV